MGKSARNFTELQDAINLFNEVHQCIRLTFGHAPDAPMPPIQCANSFFVEWIWQMVAALLLKSSLDKVNNQLAVHGMIDKINESKPVIMLLKRRLINVFGTDEKPDSIAPP